MFGKSEKILVTGGTGSLGRALVERLLGENDGPQITVFSRDELKQYEMQLALPSTSQVEYVIGDIRDRDRLKEIVPGHTHIIHTAALKQVVMGEKNPTEYIKTNILGTINLVESAIEAGVQNLVSVSTDKASSPVNLYGGTKFVADKYLLRTATNRHEIVEKGLRFSILRFGNFLNSRGSVLPVWQQQKNSALALSLTNPEMTRFWLTLEDGVNITLRASHSNKGGELLVPKLRSVRLSDLANVFAPGATIKIIGRRPGEKTHEELVSESELPYVQIDDGFFRVSPDENPVDTRLMTPIDEAEVRSDSSINLMDETEIRAMLETVKI